MKKLLFIIPLLIISCSESSSSSDAAVPDKPMIQKIKPNQAQIDQVLSLLKSENTDVLQAVYNDGGVYNWVVGVNAPYDAQGSWKGYASAMCNTLYEVKILGKDIPANTTIDHGVRVVDIGKFSDSNGSFRKASLGSTNCKTWKMSNI